MSYMIQGRGEGYTGNEGDWDESYVGDYAEDNIFETWSAAQSAIIALARDFGCSVDDFRVVERV
jgi:hypothetical protein